LTAVGLIAAGALIATIPLIFWRLAERVAYREMLDEARKKSWIDGHDAAMAKVDLRPKEWGQGQDD